MHILCNLFKSSLSLSYEGNTANYFLCLTITACRDIQVIIIWFPIGDSINTYIM